MNKYEQLVEFIINDETDKARELFHTIVVEKSRDIYESLVEEEDLDENMGGNSVADLVDEVSLDEEGISEEEDEMDMGMDQEDDMGMDQEDDMGHEEASVEDRVVDLESALDELKAEFDALMADEAGEEDHNDGMGDPEFDGEEVGTEGMYMEAEDCNEEDDEEEDLEESLIREYVEKVASPANTEGSAVGTGKSVAVNKKSTVAGKNDMGGNAVTSRGGNQNQDGNRPGTAERPKGTLVSNPQNKPGANAGKSAFKTKEAAKAGEGQTTGKPVSGTNTKSPLAR